MTTTQLQPVFMPLPKIAANFGPSEKTLRRAIRDGKLRAYMPQGRLLLDVREVEEWIRSSPVQVLAPAHADAAGGTDDR